MNTGKHKIKRDQLSSMARTCLWVVLFLLILSTPAGAHRRHHHHHHHEHFATSADEGEWLPPGWQQQPTDPNWQGKRFVSPDGTASFSAYITPVAQEPIADHMKTVAFADGEQITRLGGGRSWIEVAGFKGDRIFYRKSVLACGGTSWHEVTLEYPAEAKGMNAFVDRVAKGAEMGKDKGCPATVATGSSSVSEQPPTEAPRDSKKSPVDGD